MIRTKKGSNDQETLCHCHLLTTIILKRIHCSIFINSRCEFLSSKCPLLAVSFLPFPRPGAILFTGEDLSEPKNCAFFPPLLAPHTSGLCLGPIFTAFSSRRVKGGSREAWLHSHFPYVSHTWSWCQVLEELIVPVSGR